MTRSTTTLLVEKMDEKLDILQLNLTGVKETVKWLQRGVLGIYGLLGSFVLAVLVAYVIK